MTNLHLFLRRIVFNILEQNAIALIVSGHCSLDLPSNFRSDDCVSTYVAKMGVTSRCYALMR